jgi:hypothetical protein
MLPLSTGHHKRGTEEILPFLAEADQHAGKVLVQGSGGIGRTVDTPRTRSAGILRS